MSMLQLIVQVIIINHTCRTNPFSCLRELEDFRQQLRSAFVRRGVFRVRVHRSNVFDELLAVYSTNPSITGLEPRVKFMDEQGIDGGGLTREVISCFWHMFRERLMEGEEEKVPILSPKYDSKYYQMGQILSHGFLLTGFFPLCFNQPFTITLLSNDNTSGVTDDMLLQSFLKYIDKFESDTLKRCLDGDESNINEVVVPMLSRFNCVTRPTINNFRELILKVARHALVNQPYFVLCEIKRGMMDSHPELWQRFTPKLTHDLMLSLKPDPQRVWGMIVEQAFRDSREQSTFDFLRRLIFQLDTNTLEKFLQFVTGHPLCGLQMIQVDFNSEGSSFIRRPTANTCAMILHLPSTYTHFSSFKQDFLGILTNQVLWAFDSV